MVTIQAASLDCEHKYSSSYWMTKFADAMRRQPSSEVAFVKCQNLTKSFPTLVRGFPNIALSWPNGLKQFHTIWGTNIRTKGLVKNPNHRNLLTLSVNWSQNWSIPISSKFDPCGKAELISWGSLPGMENLWDSLTLIAESRELTSGWYHSCYKSCYIFTQCLRLSHISTRSLT